MLAHEREARANYEAAEKNGEEHWWLGFLSEGEMNRQLGSAYLDLGNYTKAERFLRESTGVVRADFPRNDTYWRIRLAQALALKGEYEEAVSLTGDALRHYWLDGSRRIRYQVVKFARILDPRRGGAAVRSFHEEIRETHREIASELSSPP